MGHPKVRGWNDPHYFSENGERISLTKEEARQMSVRYFVEFFQKKFGITISEVKGYPSNKGEFRIKMLVTEGSDSQDFQILFHKDSEVIQINETLPKASSGVSHRELFELLIFVLNGDVDEIDVTIYSLEEWKKRIEEDKQEREDEKDLENVRKEFALLFQKVHKASIRFETIEASQKGVLLKLVCPTKKGTREYVSFGHKRDDAKQKCINKAIEDKVI